MSIVAKYFHYSPIDIVLSDLVTSIGSSVFLNLTTLKSVEISNTVTSIGGSAFSGCSSLTNIEIPDSVTWISSYAFSGCSSLTNIVIPDSVTRIDSSAFSGCSSLDSITLPFVGNTLNGTRNTEFSYIFGNIPESLKKVTITGSSPIASRAFSNCSSLKIIEIPDSVTSIGGSAFSGCSSLESITLPFIGYTKDGNYNTHFGYIFGAYSYSNNSSYVPLSLKEVIITNEKTIRGYSFYGCSSLTSIQIGDTVTSIGSSAFSGCSSLTSIQISDTVTSIGSSAFYGCNSLSTITLPFIGNTKEGTSSMDWLKNWTTKTLSEVNIIGVQKNNAHQYAENIAKQFYRNDNGH